MKIELPIVSYFLSIHSCKCHAFALKNESTDFSYVCFDVEENLLRIVDFASPGLLTGRRAFGSGRVM